MVPLRATDRCNASERTLRQLGTRARAAVMNGDYLFHLSGFTTSDPIAFLRQFSRSHSRL